MPLLVHGVGQRVSQTQHRWAIVLRGPCAASATMEKGNFSMSTLSHTSAAPYGIAVAAKATDHLDAAAHPTVVEALGQESVDQLMASLRSVVSAAAAAAEALHGCVKLDVIDANADTLMTDQSNVPETVDVDKLREATAKFQEVVGQANDLASAVERILTDEQVVSRLRDEFAAKDDGADLDAIKGALASVHPGHVGIAVTVGAVIAHVNAAGKELPADVQEAIGHLEDSLNHSLKDLSSLTERCRDMAITAVDGLS